MGRGGTKSVLGLAARRKQARCSSNDAKNLPSGGPLVEQVKAGVIGATAGLVGSLAGLGGGFVMIPMMTHQSRRALVSGLGLTQHQAHGTSLFAVGSTGLFGAIGYGIKSDAVAEADDAEGNQGLVELDSAMAISATAMITARFGALFAARLSEKALQRALGAFMMFVAPLVPGKRYLLQENGERKSADDCASNDHLLHSSMIGCFSGFLSGIFGVGGGAIVVPALVLSTDTTQHTAVATSLAAMVLPSMVGTYTHYCKGNVALRVAPLIALGSAAGSYFGGRYVGTELNEDVMKAGFSVLMLVLGAKTWKKGAT